jgi:hypothetical protein
MDHGHIRKVLVAASLLAWVTSLACAALLTRSGPVFGLQLLFGGAFGPLVGEFAWYANPAFLLALCWMATYRPTPSRIAASASLVLALLPVAAGRIWLNEGYPSPIRHYGTGFQLWLGAIVLVAAATWLLPRRWPHGTRAMA